MAFSPLADMGRRIPDGGRSSKRNSKITGFTIHHQSGVNAEGEATNPRREVSANYWIRNDGKILPNVDEVRRAWTTGAKGYPAGAASDHRNITVEVSNSPEGIKNKTYAISPAAMRSLIALIGDVHKRHGLGPVKRGKTSGVAVHRDFVPTACPGPYIMAQLGYIIAEAEKARTGKTTGGGGGGTVAPGPTPVPPTPKPKPSVSIEWPGAALRVDQHWGPVSRRAYQRMLSWDVSGEYKGRIDADFAKLSIQAEQRWLKKLGYDVGPIDGVRGPRTIRALQSFLRDKKLYTGLIDGVFGPMTIAALQTYLNQQRKYA